MKFHDSSWWSLKSGNPGMKQLNTEKWKVKLPEC